jgi:predicted dehydrogenase
LGKAGSMTEIQKDILPRIGFLGLGWIGKSRLEALFDQQAVEDIYICDPYEEALAEILKIVPHAKVKDSYEKMLEENLDGIVIATPSALHAKQAMQAMEKGKAVFCQKPLGRSLAETQAVVYQAQKLNKLLSVDYSYRYTYGIQALKSFIKDKRLGKIFAVEAVFHNAYGPDKPWFYDINQSGGGCLIDLGSHLIDLVMYLFDSPYMEVRYANLISGGRSNFSVGDVEDFAEAHLSTGTGIRIRIGCSWKLAVGKDAEIYFRIYGTEGGASFHNVGGSFYDFETELYTQNNSQKVVSPPDDWGGRAIQHWAEQLAEKNEFREENYQLIKVATILDEIYKLSGR